MNLQLTWMESGTNQTFCSHGQKQLYVGRSFHDDVFLSDLRVSRTHAEITFNQGHWRLRNASKTNNPIRIGRQRLLSGEAMTLHHGATLRLGQTNITVRLEKSSNLPVELQCHNCRHIVPYQPEAFCPHCGHALASAYTVPFLS